MSSIVASITGQRGGNSGGAGLNYNAAGADVLNPATVDQANQLYGQAQNSLQNQQSFLAAVQAQNGLGNQSNVFNQLQGVANGTGPNPAQAQLAQSTGQNVAAQNALMAGQRGANANVGLLARQAAQQGAGIQQQAAGQAATMQANQSLNALNQLGGLATQQVGQQAQATGALTGATQGEQGQVLGAIQGQNNANVGIVSNQNSSNAGISAIAAKQQGDLIGNITGSIGSAIGLAEGGKVQKPQEKMADGGQPGLGVDTNFNISAPTIAPLPQIQPPAMSAPQSSSQAGPQSAVGKHFFASGNDKGSQLQGTAATGNTIGKGLGSLGKSIYNMFGSSQPATTPVSQDTANAQMFQANRPDMMTGDAEAGGAADASDAASALGDLSLAADGGDVSNLAKLAPLAAMLMARGGKVPAILSPGEVYLSPEKAKKAAKGKVDPIKAGEKIPGKSPHPGNDYRNDTVKKTLKEGGLVLPNSVMQAKHPHWAAHQFVQAHMAKQSLKKPGKK